MRLNTTGRDDTHETGSYKYAAVLNELGVITRQDLRMGSFPLKDDTSVLATYCLDIPGHRAEYMIL